MNRRDTLLPLAAKALERAICLIKQEAEAATLEALSAKDDNRNLWGQSLGTHIVDDFGTLVPVKGRD